MHCYSYYEVNEEQREVEGWKCRGAGMLNVLWLSLVYLAGKDNDGGAPSFPL